jgi:hypothetical protein
MTLKIWRIVHVVHAAEDYYLLSGSSDLEWMCQHLILRTYLITTYSGGEWLQYYTYYDYDIPNPSFILII